MTATPNLSLTLLAAEQAQKHVTMNEALTKIDAMVQLSVLTAALSAPAGAPVEGARYIVAAAPTGAWAGQAKSVAVWSAGAWLFFPPIEGWIAWNAATGAPLVYHSLAWGALSLGSPTLTDTLDTAFNLSDDGDVTKRLFFQLSGITAATTRTLTVPDANGTIALLSSNQTFAGQTTFSNAAVAVGSSIASASYSLGAGATGSGSTKAVDIGTAGVSGSVTNITLGSAVAGATGTLIFNIPPTILPQAGDPASPTNGMLWYNSTTNKLRTRQAGASVDVIGAGGGSVFSDTAFTLQDNGDATKQLLFELAGLTTGTTRTLTVPDATGTLALLQGAQTFTGAITINGVNSVLGAGTGAGTLGIGNGATLSGNTKGIDIGGGGVSGSVTNITLGSAVGGATGSLIFNIPPTILPQAGDPSVPTNGML